MVKIYLKTFLLLIVISLIRFSVSYAAENVHTSFVVGKASLSESDPEKAALRDAFRNAIESEIGVQVISESQVEGFQLVKDKILTRSEGFVKNWKITERISENDQLFLKVQVDVASGQLNKELLLNGIDVKEVYDWIGKPRILVMVPDYINGKYIGPGYASNMIEEEFIKRQLRIKTNESLSNSPIKDIYSKQQQGGIIAFGKKQDVEIIISGKSMSDLSREIKIGDYIYKFYTTTLTVKGWHISNGELLFSKSYMDCNSGDVSAIGESDAIKNSIKNCIDKAAKDILVQTVTYWNNIINKPVIYTFNIKKISYTDSNKLIDIISKINDILRVKERSFNNNVLSIEVETAMKKKDLISVITSMQSPRLNVLTVSEYAAEMEVIK